MDPQPVNWQDCLQYAELSDVGLRRANNQDAKAVAIAPNRAIWETRGHLFLVADGMGAHAAGELASKLAADIVPLAYLKSADLPAPEAIRGAVQEANAQIHSRGQASLDFKGMGTTNSTLLLLPQGAVVAHVGDSRVYRLRGDRFEQLTFDHSLVWEMRAQGQIQGKVPDYIPKNVITRSLGPNATVQVDLEGPFPLAVGDTFLLCSDGLSGPVKDEEIGTIVACLSPAEAVRALVDLACLRGGPDNITVIVARVTGAELTAGRQEGAASGRTTRKAGPVHPLVWTLLAVFSLLGIVLAAIGQGQPDNTLLWAALVSLGIAMVAGGVALFQRGRREKSILDAPGGRFGRGPYTATSAAPTQEIVDRLAALLSDLRDAAAQEQWAVDWGRLDQHGRRASAAVQARDFCQAVRENCLAISFMMAELKRQGRS